MKTTLPLLFAIVLASACTASALNEIAAFKADNAHESSSGFVWKDSAGGCTLETKDRTGISIGDKPDKGNDGKSVVFSGDQQTLLRTTTPVNVPTNALKVSLLFKPDANATTGAQTLIRQPNWEMGYSSEKSLLSLVVWHDGNSYTLVTAPVTPGAWNEVVGSLEQGMLRLETNGVEKTSEAKAPPRNNPAIGPMLVGASGREFRQLRGALADIKISAE